MMTNDESFMRALPGGRSLDDNDGGDEAECKAKQQKKKTASTGENYNNRDDRIFILYAAFKVSILSYGVSHAHHHTHTPKHTCIRIWAA